MENEEIFEKINHHKKYLLYFLFGLIIWFIAILLRELGIHKIYYLKFFLAAAPNFAFVLLAFGVGMILFQLYFKKPFTFLNNALFVGLIFIFLILSEIIFFVFLSTPWDNYDLLASLIASIMILLIEYNQESKNTDNSS